MRSLLQKSSKKLKRKKRKKLLLRNQLKKSRRRRLLFPSLKRNKSNLNKRNPFKKSKFNSLSPKRSRNTRSLKLWRDKMESCNLKK